MADQTIDYGALASKYGLSVSDQPPATPAVDYAGLAKSHGLTISDTPPQASQINYAALAAKHGLTISDTLEARPYPSVDQAVQHSTPAELQAAMEQGEREGGEEAGDYPTGIAPSKTVPPPGVPRPALPAALGGPEPSPLTEAGRLIGAGAATVGQLVKRGLQTSPIPEIPITPADSYSPQQVPVPGIGTLSLTPFTKTVLNTITRQATPENLGTMLAGSLGGELLQAAVNSDAVIGALKTAAPIVQKGVNAAAAGAVPGAFGIIQAVQTGKGGIEAKQAYDESQAARNAGDTATADAKLEQAKNLAVGAATNAVMGALSFIDARSAGKAATELYPPAAEIPNYRNPYTGETVSGETVGAAPVSPITPEQAAATAANLEASGNRLAAQAWRQEGNITALGNIQGKPAYLLPPMEVPGESGKTRFAVHTVSDADGNILSQGSAQEVGAFLQRNRVNIDRPNPIFGTPSQGLSEEAAEGIASVPAETRTFSAHAAQAPVVGESYPMANGTALVKSVRNGLVTFEHTQPGGQVSKPLTISLELFQRSVNQSAPQKEQSSGVDAAPVAAAPVAGTTMPPTAANEPTSAVQPPAGFEQTPQGGQPAPDAAVAGAASNNQPSAGVLNAPNGNIQPIQTPPVPGTPGNGLGSEQTLPAGNGSPALPGLPGSGAGTPDNAHPAGAGLPGPGTVASPETEDIVTANVDKPLTAKGEADADKLANNATGVTSIETTPMARGLQTARRIAESTDAGVEPRVNDALGPWDLGDFAGKRQSDVNPQINDYIANKPDEPVPGGESFNQFRQRFIGGLQQAIDTWHPGDKPLLLTHSIGIHTAQAWFANGAPESGEISTPAMLQRQHMGPTAMWRIDPQAMEMNPVQNTSKDGVFIARHADTAWDNLPKAAIPGQASGVDAAPVAAAPVAGRPAGAVAPLPAHGAPPQLPVPQTAIAQEPLSPIAPEAEQATPEQAPAAGAAATDAASKPQPFDFASTQTNLSGPVSKAILNFGKTLPAKILAEKGRESEPHITVKYGLHNEDPSAVQALLSNEGPITATLGKASLFHTPDADVLKVDVDSPDLHRLNAIVNQLPHTDTHPSYQPHVTIAYLKPGEGAQYDGKALPGITKQTVTFTSLTFSDRDGNEVEIPLTGKSSIIYITGATFDYKNEIRRLNARWNNGMKAWELPDTPENRRAVERISKRLDVQPPFLPEGAHVLYADVKPGDLVEDKYGFQYRVTGSMRGAGGDVYLNGVPANAPEGTRPSNIEKGYGSSDRWYGIQKVGAPAPVQAPATPSPKATLGPEPPEKPIEQKPPVPPEKSSSIPHNFTVGQHVTVNTPHDPRDRPAVITMLDLRRFPDGMRDGIRVQFDDDNTERTVHWERVSAAKPPVSNTQKPPASEPLPSTPLTMDDFGIGDIVRYTGTVYSPDQWVKPGRDYEVGFLSGGLVTLQDPATHQRPPGSSPRVSPTQLEIVRKVERAPRVGDRVVVGGVGQGAGTGGAEFGKVTGLNNRGVYRITLDDGREVTAPAENVHLGGIQPAPNPQPPTPVPGSFKFEFKERGHDWSNGNAHRFATAEEAQSALDELGSRWMGMPSEHRVVPSTDPVSHWFDKETYRARPIAEKPASAPSPQTPAPAEETTGPEGLADAVYRQLKAGHALGNITEFNRLAEKYLGDRTSGQWTPKDGFEAMEAGMNKLILEKAAEWNSMPFEQALAELRKALSLMTSQGTRTDEQLKLQQFSTPPTEAFTAVKAAHVNPDDVMWEPSAGNGGIASFAKGIGAKVVVNEVDAMRARMLKHLGFDEPSALDGETIAATMPRNVDRPTVVVMNPPFSSGGLKSHAAKNDNKYGFNHVDSALQALLPGGRLVAILGGGRADDLDGGASLRTGPSGHWFHRIAQMYNVRANVRIAGKEYQKYGTSFATRIIVIDKTGPTPSQTQPGRKSWSSTVNGAVETLDEAYNLLRGIANDRPAITTQPAGETRPGQGVSVPGQGATGGNGNAGAGSLPGTGGRPVSGNGQPEGPGSVSGLPGGQRPAGTPETTPVHQPGNGLAGHPAPAGNEGTPGDTGNLPVGLPAQQPGVTNPQDIIDRIRQGLQQSRPQAAPAPAPTSAPAPAPARAPRAPRAPKAATPKAPAPSTQAPAPAQAPVNPFKEAADAALQAMRDKYKNKADIQAYAPTAVQLQPSKIDADDLVQVGLKGAELMFDGVTGWEDWQHQFMTQAGDVVRAMAEAVGEPIDTVLHQIHYYAAAAVEPMGVAVDPPPAPQSLEGTENINEAEQDSAGYVKYQPKVKGPAHPGDIVETQAMATVPTPPFTIKLNLPPEAFTDGRLSAVQLEAIAMGAQMNEVLLPGGERAAALCGDGTGVGKGRIAAGYLQHNWNSGRKRLVFVTEKRSLMQDITRDLVGIKALALTHNVERKGDKYVFNKGAGIRVMHDWKGGSEIKHEGIVFVTYSLMRAHDAKGNQRDEQLRKYLAGDDNGEGAVIVFDEAHNLKNAVASGRSPASLQGTKARQLMAAVPGLRSFSLTATAATDVVNLGYMDRLGLWGPGTAFPGGFNQFVSAVGNSGMSAMELIAMELKAQGKYCSRTLSYKGVTYDETKHELNEDQKAIYRTAAEAWGTAYDLMSNVINNLTNGGSQQKANAMIQFYAAQLRFFGVLLTALKTPTAVRLAQEARARGESVVISLVNTNEAQQKREETRSAAASDDDEEQIIEYDFGPAGILKDMIKEHFPTAQWADDVDDQGNPIKVPVTHIDEHGNTIQDTNPEAERVRDEFLARIERDLHLPENPLDILINSLGGPSKVAELTGRAKRFDASTQKFVPRGDPNVSRRDLNVIEAANFQNGKKHFAIMSGAANTGITMSADLTAKNQEKRLMIILQPGWQADKVIQGMGRVHRSNQAHTPGYQMVYSDLGGETRFVSTIARRIGSLGALTKGQKTSLGGVDLMEKVNFETAQGRAATNAFYEAMLRNRPIPGTSGTDDALSDEGQAAAHPAGARIKVAHAGIDGDWEYGTTVDPVPAKGDVQYKAGDMVRYTKPGWMAGRQWEVTSVNDGYTDRDGQTKKPWLGVKDPTGQYRTGLPTLNLDEVAPWENGVNVKWDDGSPGAPDRDNVIFTGEQRPNGQPMTGRSILASLHLLRGHAGGGETVPPRDRQNVTKLLNRLMALDPDIQNPVYNYFYDIFTAAVQHAVEDGTLDVGVKTMPGDEFNLKESRVISTEPKTGAQTFYYPVNAQVRTNRISPKELAKRRAQFAEQNPRILRDAHGNLALVVDARPVVHEDGRIEPASRVCQPTNGNWRRVANATIRAPEINEWAAETSESAAAEVERLTDSIARDQESLQRWGGEYYRTEVAKNQNKLAKAQKNLDDAKAIQADPEAFIREEWENQYSVAPSHITTEHHLIGGAVLRWWNAIHDVTPSPDIYTAVDEATKRRIVGVEIPAESINALLARITGSRTTVNANQLNYDVMRNGLQYRLETGIQVRRGRVAGRPVLQFITHDDNVARNLVSMGVLHERGVQPIYYAPNDPGTARDAPLAQQAIVDRIVQAYPILPEEDTTPAAAGYRPMPGFYSQLERTIEAKMPAKANAPQIMGILNNPQNGVKQDEVKWSGLEPWLMKQGQVTKQQVLDYLKANEVQVEEVEHAKEADKLEERLSAVRNELRSLGLNGTFITLGMPEAKQARVAQLIEERDALEDRLQRISVPKYDQYVLPGGKNYRELLLTLPAKTSGRVTWGGAQDVEVNLHAYGRGVETTQQWEASDGALIQLSPTGRGFVIHGPLVQNAALPTLEAAKQFYQEQKNKAELTYRNRREMAGNYTSAHWDEPNVLAHIRFNDHTDADGKRDLHVEEIQSDWHQQGKKQGYAPAAAEIAAVKDEVENRYGLPWKDSSIGQLAQRGAPAEFLQRYQDAANGAAGIKVPAAPFAKTWHELAFRRMLRWAAENGYDRLTWTTGAQQAERYDLKKHVSRVEYDPQQQRLAAWDKNGSQISLPHKQIPPEEIQDYIGKEPAKQLLEAPRLRFDEWPMRKRAGEEITGRPAIHVLHTKDLAIGGEGMKGFYDQILPAYASKLGKKWGAKVGKTEIKIGGPRIAGYDQIARVHSIDITPAMRESVMQGQALFNIPAPHAPIAPTTVITPRLSSKYERTKPYMPSRSLGYHIQNAVFEGIALSPADSTYAKAYVVNQDAMAFAASFAGFSMDDAAMNLRGLHMDPHNARKVASMCATMKQPYTTVPEALDQLHQFAARAAAENKSLILVADHETFPDWHKAIAMREELDHALQSGSTQTLTRYHLGDSATWLTQGSEPGRVAAATITKRYGYLPQGMLAAEVGVRLMRPEGYRELGINSTEARFLAAQYVRALRREYGTEQPRAIAERVFAAAEPRGTPGSNRPQSLRVGPGQAVSAERSRTNEPVGQRDRNAGDQGEAAAFRPSRVAGAQAARLQELFKTPEDDTSTERKQGGPGLWISPQGKAIPLTGENGIATHGQTAMKLTGVNNARMATTQLLDEGYIRVRGGSVQTGHAPVSFDSRLSSALQAAKAGAPGQDIQIDTPEGMAVIPPHETGQFLANPQAYLRPSGTNLLRGEYGGTPAKAPKLADLKAALVAKFGPDDAPKANYSALGSLKRIIQPGQSLAEVESAAPKVFEAAIRTGGSMSQASTVLHSAMPAIMKALKGSPVTWDALAIAYDQSRLDGIRDRWNGFADQAAEMTEEDLKDFVYGKYSSDHPNPTLQLLSNIEGRAGLAQDLGQTAAALAEKQDWDTLRDFLEQTFNDAASRVQRIMAEPIFDHIRDQIQNNPQVAAAHRIYKDQVEAVMAQNHALNEGVFSDSLGPLNTYYPLIPVDKQTVAGPGRRLPYHPPKNIANAFATGLSEGGYSVHMEDFARRLASAIRANDKATLIKTLRDTGWLKPQPGNWDGTIKGPDGEVYEGAQVETGQARLIIQNGKVTHIPASFGVMPKFMERGLRPILAKEPSDPNEVAKMMAWANMLATKGPYEFLFHSSGVLGSIYSNTPFLGGSGLDKALSLPLIKWAAIRGKLLSIDPTTPENIAKLQKMAQAGAMPARSAKVTYSREFAEATGAKVERASFGPLLFGPKGLDARARILMYDIFQAAFPAEEQTPNNLYHFVNQLGNYTPEFQGEIEKFVKRIGLGPFATAGMTRMVNAMDAYSGAPRAAFGAGPYGKMTPEARAWMWAASSIMAVALWVIGYKQLTGQWPLEDKRAKLFSIPVGDGNGYIDQFRHSKLGDAMWGTGPEVGYLNFNWYNPLPARGARMFGVPQLFQTMQAGGTGAQMAQSAFSDISNTLAHPFEGPATRSMFVLGTGLLGKGLEPYVEPGPKLMPATSNIRKPGFMGGLMPSLSSAPAQKRAGYASEVGATIGASVRELNSFYGDLGEHTGFLGSDKGQVGNTWLKMLMNLNPITQEVFQPASSPEKREKALRRDAAAAGSSRGAY